MQACKKYQDTFYINTKVHLFGLMTQRDRFRLVGFQLFLQMDFLDPYFIMVASTAIRCLKSSFTDTSYKIPILFLTRFLVQVYNKRSERALFNGRKHIKLLDMLEKQSSCCLQYTNARTHTHICFHELLKYYCESSRLLFCLYDPPPPILYGLSGATS